jgi:hypothetical protein
MYHLVYTSHASHPLSQNELIELLRESRNNNTSLNITGMLVYLNGKFIQVIEGRKASVLDLFNRIISDTRHRRVIKVMEGNSSTRIFKDWSMGFKSLSYDDFADITGFKDIDLFFHEEHAYEKGNLLMTFLTLFYKKNLGELTELPNFS